MTKRLLITDVALRDGLQSQPTMVPTEGKHELIRALFAAGLRRIEATSFVSPQAVPQMAAAGQLLRDLKAPEAAVVSVLVPNMRGLERAAAAGAKEIAVVLSATETMNQKNIRMGLDEAVASCKRTLMEASRQGLRTRAYIAVAFACPFEGPTPPDRVAKLAKAMQEVGAGEVVIADTIGAAAPVDILQVLGGLRRYGIPPDTIGIHLHDTRGMALANAWCAIEEGVRRFDTSIGGLGGCPFAPGAAGNLATEDLALMAHQCGLETGIDLERLLDAVDVAGRLVGYSVGGRSHKWQSGKREG